MIPTNISTVLGCNHDPNKLFHCLFCRRPASSTIQSMSSIVCHWEPAVCCRSSPVLRTYRPSSIGPIICHPSSLVLKPVTHKASACLSDAIIAKIFCRPKGVPKSPTGATFHQPSCLFSGVLCWWLGATSIFCSTTSSSEAECVLLVLLVWVGVKKLQHPPLGCSIMSTVEGVSFPWSTAHRLSCQGIQVPGGAWCLVPR